MKIVTIIGARPQFVKAAMVSKAIKDFSTEEKPIIEIIVHTGQHFDKNMSDVFFEEMRIPEPNYNLEINSLSHGAMTGKMLEKIEEILLKEIPDWVLVYGDTNSTLVGALAAKKLHIKVAHVEAGLRSYNTKMPEEINRILTDRISDVLFCPTQIAINNLKKEGFDNMDSEVVLSGDVMEDAALFYKELSKPPNFEISKPFILATIHRAENTDNRERLTSIFNALNTIAEKIQIILPLHPRTKLKIEQFKIYITKNISITDPIGYLEMVYLLNSCELVITDSGGVQKEAYFFKKRCITSRDETEWTELVENGFNTLAGADPARIVKAFYENKENLDFSKDLYGNGNASKNIVNALWKKHLDR